MTSWPRNSARPAGAFTMIELLLVMFVMALLTVMAVPSLARFNKTNKVDQTVKVVLSAVRQARYAAINMRRVVAVMYGDDFGGIDPKPTPGVLPAWGEIEIWCVLQGVHDCPYIPDLPYNPSANYWYPYRFADVAITPQPISFPEGVRIITGDYDSNTKNFNFGSKYKKEPRGEIVRHQTMISQDGSKPAWWSSAMSCVLVFEQSTGMHAVIQTGADWSGYIRPKVITRKIERIGGVPLGSPLEINERINRHPGTN